MAKKCYLYSKANHPVTIKYDKADLVIPPNAKKFLLEDTTKVGVLPSSIRKVDIEEGGK
jgi:hypothetical protein